MDMFSNGVKRGKVGRPSKSTPEKRAAYDRGRRQSQDKAAEDKAAKTELPETRFSNGLKRRRVGPK